MKKFLSLLFLSFLLITSCNKDDFEYTGTLKMTFKISGKTDYSSIEIDVYSMENLSFILTSGNPDNNGLFTKELLPGNYRASIYYNGNRANPTFQIINGKNTTFDYDF